MEKIKKQRLFNFIITILIIAFAASITVAVVLLGKKEKENDLERVEFTETFNGKIKQWSKTIETVERNVPSASFSEGLNERYPVYGTSLADVTEEEKDNLIKEANLLIASPTTYDSMDEEGNYYLNGTATGKKLYKHVSSTGMYCGDVDDNEKAVKEKITITADEVRNYVTGLYAPAGEVIKLEISQEDLDKIGGSYTVLIGQTSHRNDVNNIWKARNDFSRMPIIVNKITVNTATAYAGYALGGPIYIYPSVFGQTFSVTVSGAVKYARFIYGRTTEEEVEEMKTYSAPYYDYEIWDLGVRHSGPSKFGSYDYDNLLKSGELWEKIIRTSRQVPCSANSSIGVCYVYDCFVAAGAACAFQGGNSWINAPCSWLSGALNYDSMVSEGFWGIIHEYNHLYQSYGMESSKTNEVTNNATSLLSYVLYTNISQKRSLSDDTISGWNRFTDPSRSLRETLSLEKNGEAQSSLNAYADIIHTFGVDVFAKATRAQKGFGIDAWYEALSLVTDYNFTYYFEEILHQPVSEEKKLAYDTKDRIVFVPVAAVFQTGRSFYSGKTEVFSQTVKPFLIENGKSLVLDFNERIVLPDDYSFTIKNISSPENGSIIEKGENVYEYTPNNEKFSGTIYLTIALEGKYATQDVTLSMEFEQYYKNQVDVTKYTYSADRKYSTVQEAVENDFMGYTDKVTYKSNSTFLNGLSNGQIGIVEGKIYIEKTANYALCLRSGRGNNTLYVAINDSALNNVLSLNSDHKDFLLSGEHVITLALNEGDYLYFKEITLSRHASDAYTELGLANLDEPSPSMQKVATSVLYETAGKRENKEFTSAEKYPRKYTSEKIVYSSSSENHSLISANMSCWDETAKIENIFDGNPETFYHNQQNVFVSETNPFILVADTGKENIFNSITVTSRKVGQYNLPVTFSLKGSLDGDVWFEIGNFSNLTLNGNTVTTTFKESNFRFYRLEVTDTKSQSSPNKYVTLSNIRFDYVFVGEEKSAHNLEYYKDKETDWKEKEEISSFGKTITGNGIIKYSFKGTGFLLVCKQTEYCKIKVSINSLIKEYELSPQNEPAVAFFSTDDKANKTDVKIEILEGELTVDSFITA